jgi:glycosyltransferase involved in cell wall biosynthesis
MSKVSVIIPFYNLGEFLPEAITSVEKQSFTDWELIIVNDGSTEQKSLDVLSTYRSKYKVIDKENSGLPDTRNYAINLVESDFVVCLDADDILDSKYLEKCLAEFIDEKVGFVTTWGQFFDQRQGVWETSDYNLVRLLGENCIHVASMFRRSSWKAVSGYNTNMTGYQDWDFWLSICELGNSWRTVREPLFHYRVRKNSMVTSSDKKRLGLINQIVEKHQELYRKNIVKFVGLQDEKLQDILKREHELRDTILSQDSYINEQKQLIKEMELVVDEFHHFKQTIFYKISRKLSKHK